MIRSYTVTCTGTASPVRVADKDRLPVVYAALQSAIANGTSLLAVGQKGFTFAEGQELFNTGSGIVPRLILGPFSQPAACDLAELYVAGNAGLKLNVLLVEG